MQGENKRYLTGGFEVLEFEELASTNTVAEGMEELKDRKVVLTWCQTAGRGQATNRWESEPHKNISMTVILEPENLPAGDQFAISMVVALGCRDFVSRYVEGVSVKWPNDIYVGDYKIAGILIEHRIAGANVQRSLCGIGLNVNQAEFISDAPNPISLFQLIRRELPLRQALEELLSCIGKRYEQLEELGQLREEFIKRMYRTHGIYDWEDGEGRFRGESVGLDEYGQLVLRDTEGRERIYAFKEVKYC
jgi:BirA family biotin operon repressor/biotin-[acetyl-CoA-carboxylase] ligase